jgi:hypothetical protein
MSSKLEFKSIKEFYPYYLTQHREKVCRTLHFIGSGLVIALFIAMLMTKIWWLFFLLPLVGYGFAWTGHFFFEKNKPAAFKNPLWSLACDFIMFADILTGRINDKMKMANKLFPQG